VAGRDAVEHSHEQRENLLERIRARAQQGKPDELRAALSEVPAADLAEVLDVLEREEKVAVIEALRSELAGEVLTEVSDESLRELAKAGLDAVTDAVRTMEPDEVADVLEALPEDATRSVLSGLPRKVAQTAKRLLRYGSDTAGGIMTPEFVLLAANITAANAIAITQRSRESETIAHLFVSDEQDRLVGYLPLHRLVFARADRTVGELMETDLVTVRPETDQEEVVRLATKYDLQVVPVVDARSRLLGVVTADDILEAAQEEVNEDFYRLAGSGVTDPLHQSILVRSLLRLPWLTITLGMGFLSGQIMRWLGYEPAGTTALLLFVPVMIDMAGNVSLQSSSTMVRGLAVGHVQLHSVSSLFVRELAVGAVIGACCGGLAGLVAFFFFGGNLGFALVVGFSMFCGIISAVTSGTGVPLLCNWVGVDPALASGPFVTSLNDITGIFIYLGLGASLLKYLPS